MREQLIRWHRRLAILAVVPLLAWSLTGLLHPLMSRWQPSAVAMKPPTDLVLSPVDRPWSDLPAPAITLPDGLQLRELRALTWQQRPYWMVQTASGERHYYEAESGKAANIEPAIIQALARHYTGVKSPILSVREITAFDDEYAFVNRYLPVWRVAFDQPDGLVVFIEPRSFQLTGLTDTWKTRFSFLFSNLHSWKWWPHEPSRDVAMVSFLSTAILLILSGLLRARAMKVRPVTTKTTRWHRRIGWCVAAAALAWTSSGIFHLLAINKGSPAFATYPLTHTFNSDELTHRAPKINNELARLQIVATSAGPLWREWGVHSNAHVQIANHEHHSGAKSPTHLLETYASARTGEVVQPTEYVRELTASASQQAKWLSTEAITQFTSEYGFVQKRLPVYRVMFEGELSVYIDPADAAVAAVVKNVDRAEGFSFAYLHKGHWFDFLGKDARDAILALFALSIFVMASTGIILLRRARHSL